MPEFLVQKAAAYRIDKIYRYTLEKWGKTQADAYGLAIMFCWLAAAGCSPHFATQQPLLRIEEAHRGGATRLEFALDGKRMATGGRMGEISIRSVPAGRLLQDLRGHAKMVRGLAWADEDLLISAGADGRLLVWSLSQSRVLHRQQSSEINCLAFMPKKRLIFTGHRDGYVRSWSFPELDKQAEHLMTSRIRSVAASHDERLLAASDSSSGALLLDPELKALRELPTGGRDALELRFSPDDATLASGAWFHLLLWDVSDGSFKVMKTEHLGAVISVDFTPDGKHLVSLGRITDSKIRLIDVETGEVVRRLRQHDLCGYAVRVSPGGAYIGSASEDRSVRLYDLATPYRPTLGALP